jgi:hypothetical protein
LQRLVEKPVDVLLENTCHNLDQSLRWYALAVLDHGKIGHGRARFGVDLHAANREIFECQVVSLAQRLDFGTQEVRSSTQAAATFL